MSADDPEDSFFDPALRAELTRIYATEAADLVDRLERELGAMDGGQPGAAVEVRRTLHSLKGGAYSAGLRALGDLAHALEERLGEGTDAGAVAVVRGSLQDMEHALNVVGRGEDEPRDRLEQARQRVATSGDAAPAPDDPATVEEPEAVGRVNLDVLESLAMNVAEAASQVDRLVAQLDAMRREASGARRERAGVRGRLDDVRSAARAVQGVLAAASHDSGRLRLRPMAQVLDGARRSFDDALARTGKRGLLVMDGGAVQVERRVGQLARTMLMHLVRNAVDHGFDAPSERAAHGKGELPTLRVTVEARGLTVAIAVEDDGRGIDWAAVERIARERGALRGAVDRDALTELIFSPGFSTRPSPSATSGRGVGLDVVRATAEGLGGRLRLESRAGLGTRIDVEVPTSLVTTRLLVVSREGRRAAVPLLSAVRILALPREPVVVGGAPTVVVDGQRLLVVDLAAVLGVGAPADSRLALVLDAGLRRIAVGVDSVDDDLEAPIRPIGEPLGALPSISGIALIGGRVLVPVIDVLALARSRSGEPARSSPPRSTQPAVARTRTVMVVDDSVTTRALEEAILRQAGYRVVVATDGGQALDLLATEGVDVVVTDLEMPTMDGIELLRRLRASKEARLATMPVIMVTSRADQESVARAAGADAFVMKRAFDHEQLLDTVERLLATRKSA